MARSLIALSAAVALLLGGPPAWSQSATVAGPSPGNGLLLLLTVKNDSPLGQGMSARLAQHISNGVKPLSTAGGVGAPKLVAIVQPPAGAPKLDPDDELDKIGEAIRSQNAQAALVADVTVSDSGVAARTTLLVPDQSAQPGQWTVAVGDESVELPLAYGVFRFDSVSVRYDHVVPDQATLPGAALGAVTKFLRLNDVPRLRKFYASEATDTEDNVASFVAGVMAYHAGDFVQAERLFARVEDLAQAGSSTRANAAVFRLAAAARAAPLLARADGHKGLGPWSRSLRDVNHLGDVVLKEFPWSIDARKVMVAFHLEVAAEAPDSLFNGTLTRGFEKKQAKHYLKGLDKLLEDQDPWSRHAHRVLDAIDTGA
jgi:hypothetical protein